MQRSSLPLLSLLFTVISVVGAPPATIAAQPESPPAPPEMPLPEGSPAARDVDRCLDRLRRAISMPPPGNVVLAEGAELGCSRAGRRDARVDVRPLVAYHAAVLAWARRTVHAAEAEEGRRDEQVAALRAFERDRVSTSWSSPADNQVFDAALAAYRQRGEALLVLMRGADAETMGGARGRLRQEADAVQRSLEALAELLQRAIVDPTINEAAFLEARWSVVARLYPDEPAFARAHALVQAWVARHGSRDGARDARRAAEAAAGAQRGFPVAASREPALEADMRRVFEAQGWNEPVLALHLTSGWREERDATGSVVGRRRDAAVGVRLPDGVCRVYDFTFFQPRLGAGWGELRRSSHSSATIACENVPR
ncbi:MAG: hypothetical protein KC668_29365 [Myxococcales bacterium]|nr:hypothetical protein [Myxococcales bacterium]